MALFLPDNHDELAVLLFALVAGNGGAGNDHAGVYAVLILSADFGKVVVDIFQDVPQAKTLRMAHNAHLFHGRQAAVEQALNFISRAWGLGERQGLNETASKRRWCRLPV